MKLNVLFGISAVYMALVGLGFLFSPAAVMFGSIGPDASAALIANLRGISSTFLAIAVLNWMVRNAEASKARDAVVLANTIGFGLAGILGVVAALGGAPAMQWGFAVINLGFAVWFFLAGKASMSAS